jgi:hypothetical protein
VPCWSAGSACSKVQVLNPDVYGATALIPLQRQSVNSSSRPEFLPMMRPVRARAPDRDRGPRPRGYFVICTKRRPSCFRSRGDTLPLSSVPIWSYGIAFTWPFLDMPPFFCSRALWRRPGRDGCVSSPVPGRARGHKAAAFHNPQAFSNVQEENRSCARDQVVVARPPVLTPPMTLSALSCE